MILVYILTAVFSKFESIGKGGIHSFPVYICHGFFIYVLFHGERHLECFQMWKVPQFIQFSHFLKMQISGLLNIGM